MIEILPICQGELDRSDTSAHTNWQDICIPLCILSSHDLSMSDCLQYQKLIKLHWKCHDHLHIRRSLFHALLSNVASGRVHRFKTLCNCNLISFCREKGGPTRILQLGESIGTFGSSSKKEIGNEKIASFLSQSGEISLSPWAPSEKEKTYQLVSRV